MIHNIYAKFRKQNEAFSKTEMVKRVSEAAGIGLTLVWQTIKEMEETHAVKSPPRKRNRKILFDERLAEVGNSPKVTKLELEFTVNTGSSDESDDLEWELETGDVSTENDILTDYVSSTTSNE
jgi:hypothetical protein